MSPPPTSTSKKNSECTYDMDKKGLVCCLGRDLAYSAMNLCTARNTGSLLTVRMDCHILDYCYFLFVGWLALLFLS